LIIVDIEIANHDLLFRASPPLSKLRSIFGLYFILLYLMIFDILLISLSLFINFFYVFLLFDNYLVVFIVKFHSLSISIDFILCK